MIPAPPPPLIPYPRDQGGPGSWRGQGPSGILWGMRRVRRGDGGRPVHRGLLVALFLLLGICAIARGVQFAVDAHTLDRDGAVADGVVLTYHHTAYAGNIGRVYIGPPEFRDVPVSQLRRHDPGDQVRVRYTATLAAEDGAPLNVDAIAIWIFLGVAVLAITGWTTRLLYREQQDWERLEADLLGGR